MKSLAWMVAALAAVAGGCGDDDGVTPNVDAGPADAGHPRDAGGDAGGDPDAGPSDAGSPDAGPPSGPRLVVVSREGEIASLDLAAPWTVRATASLGATIASIRCQADRCVVVHADSLSIVDAHTLAHSTFELERGAGARDVAFVGPSTLVVSRHERDSLLVVDLDELATSTISLASLADADGLPEADRLAACGRRVFVQLRRVDHESGAPSALPGAIARIDLDAPSAAPAVATLAARPAFDMPIDCDSGVLYVSEPAPLMMGGSRYQRVDLETLAVTDLPLTPGAEGGGFEVAREGLYWTITHTEFGPGPSSHLTLEGIAGFPTHNTFASEHVDDLALDHRADLLFYPDPCTPGTTGCARGIHVWTATTGAPASSGAIDVGFGPIDLAIAR